jgi:hypothetical protein
MTQLSNPLAAGLGVLGLTYLAAMVISGALPQQRQLVRFEARGVMQVQPESITRVDLTQDGRTVRLQREPDAAIWSRADGTRLSQAGSAHLSMAVQMMNTSEPVKQMPEEALEGVDRTPFGLDAPLVQAALFRGGQRIVEARFGNLNPEGYLQYMAVADMPGVFLMSRFVGAEWRQAAQEVFERAPAPERR